MLFKANHEHKVQEGTCKNWRNDGTHARGPNTNSSIWHELSRSSVFRQGSAKWHYTGQSNHSHHLTYNFEKPSSSTDLAVNYTLTDKLECMAQKQLSQMEDQFRKLNTC